ncbi:ubiquinol oxidase subunit II [Salinisphaera sp. LB1]|uniref:ubiquinol oxidase subunit II n=1 Tax=Salinisphaera sp. LB1 TaxID=2183911 RepID=UPI000D708D27|nr:ubiquinol oxidase subunit II [Salinisphaera sp. LB1]AWN16058.1 Cytochrome O ubiquinol oxidase subunit II [Salinisphaera sp. LB1]
MLGKIFRFSSGVSAAALLLLISGCGTSLSTMMPVGPVGQTERDITLFTLVLMMFVLIPIVALTFGIAWRYRKSNTDSRYSPDWDHSWLIEVFVWGGPVVILIILSVMTWISTHNLDPYKAIQSDAKPITIEAVATDWKWLFIYPDQHVAAVNEFAFPKDVPLNIRLTSNSVMNAFMIQRMGTQIFAMSGMKTQLHLMSHKTGDFAGGNYQYNGHGFAKNRFVARAMTEQNYKQWLAKVRSQGKPLDMSTFKQFAQPSVVKDPIYFAPVSSGLFADVIGQFHPAKSPGMKPDMKAELKPTAAHE